MSLTPLSQYCIKKSRELDEVLYLVKFISRDSGKIVYEFFHHSFAGNRIVIAGGNAGMPYPDEFEGDERGFCFPGYHGRHWRVSEVKEIPLSQNGCKS